MRRTRIIGKNQKIYSDRFDSVSEFFSVVMNAQPKDSYSSKDLCQTLKDDNERFRGLTNENIMKYRLNYPEGVESLRMLPELNIRKGGVKYAYRWDDQDGDDMDMPRYFEGMACMRKRYKTAGDGQQGRFVEVKVKVDENGYVKYSAMLWKTYTLCRIVDQLEAAGIRVRVSVCDYSEMFWGEYQLLGLEIKIKDYNEPLNMGLIATICSPWFFRYWVFKYSATQFALTSSGVGRSISLGTFFSGNEKAREELGMTERRDLILIDSGECLSKEAADKFIKSLEI